MTQIIPPIQVIHLIQPTQMIQMVQLTQLTQMIQLTQMTQMMQLTHMIQLTQMTQPAQMRILEWEMGSGGSWKFGCASSFSLPLYFSSLGYVHCFGHQ